MKKKVMFFKAIVLLQIIGTSLFAQGNKGFELLKRDKISEARKFFISEMNSKPQDPKVYFDLGSFYLKLNNTDSAQIYFKKGTEIAPADLNCQLGMGAIYAIKGNLGEALKVERVLGIDKTKNIDWVLFMLDAWIKSPNAPEGKIDGLLTRAKEINKANPNIYLVKANLSIKNQKAGETANDYEMAIYFDSTNVEANSKLGDIYAAVKNKEQSIKAYLRAIKKDSTFPPALRGLGELYYDYGNYAKSAFIYGKYIENGEINTKELQKFGTILYFSKDYAKSIDVLSKIKGDNENFVLKRIIGYDQFELKDYANSLNSLKQFFALVKDKSKILYTDYEYYGKSLAKNAMDSLAIENFMMAMKIDSSKTGIYENIAQSYQKQKKYLLAVEYFEKLIKSRTTPLPSDFYQFGLVNYYAAVNSTDTVLKSKLLIQADTAFGSFISLNSKSQLGYLSRARVNSQIDTETTKGLAKPYYEKVVEICSADPVKFKKELIESYQYMGFYYYVNKDNATSKSFWQKVLELDPADTKALDAMKGIK
ncbi:MAG: tetratricopeptide repeat protein [Bacteroidota bacterium]